MRGALILLSTVCLAACEVDLDLDDWDPPNCRGLTPQTPDHPCRDLWIEPELGREGSSIIIGDTAVLTLRSDYGLKSADWTVTGKAIAGWDGSKVITGAHNATSITVKAMETGTSMVRATASSYASTTATFTVVDSTAIVHLLLNAPEQIRRGDSASVSFAVQDANFFGYRTYPALSLSDSTLALVRRTVTIMYAEPRYTARVVAKATGIVTLTASFGALSASRTITIVP